jgi:hypothetical protein
MRAEWQAAAHFAILAPLLRDPGASKLTIS